MYSAISIFSELTFYLTIKGIKHMEITIRPTVITDFERLIKVETAATPGLSYLPNVFGTFLNDTSGAFLTAEFDGEIVGCGKFSVMPDGSAWLETLRVLPEYQGKGIGRKMLKKGFEWLSDMKYIEIGVLEYNEIAIEWYKRLDFEFTGEKEDFTVGDFVGKDWVLKMKKVL